jgi:hypothetical protein
MVPELATGAAAELSDLRAAVFAAVGELPARWIAVGIGSTDEVIGSDAVGTFGGYGVDVRVGLSDGELVEATRLPLCALITGWVRGQVSPDAKAEVRVYSEGLGVDVAVARGRALRAEIDGAGEAIGVLVVADGANTLTPPAPGGYDPDAAAVQTAVDDALGSGDVGALAELSAGIVGRVAYQVLAGLAEPAQIEARELFRGAPYGVGYFVGVWEPTP